MVIFQLILVLIISYLFGSIPCGFLIGKLKGIDIREHGSKNIGATNITRVLGKPFGYICFALDFFKGFLPSYLMIFVITLSSAPRDAGVILAILGTFLGHIFPIYLKFKGGKGVATGTGAILAISPLAAIVGFFVWVIIFKITRYVSVASIIAAIIVPLLTICFSATGTYQLSICLQIFVAIIGAIAIIKHKANITRLINGTEYSFEKKN